jgi:hypothetical protein
MDSNQTSQPTPTPEQKGGYNMAYVIVGVFSLIVLAAVAVPFTLNVFKGGQDQTLVDKQEVAEDTKSLNAYRDGTSAEAAKAYVDGVDARIQAGNISDAARDLLLLRKAGVMSTARGDAETIKSNAKVATQLFRDFINRSNPNTSDLYFRKRFKNFVHIDVRHFGAFAQTFQSNLNRINGRCSPHAQQQCHSPNQSPCAFFH